MQERTFAALSINAAITYQPINPKTKMTTIWKNELSLHSVQDISIPENAELLSAREQGLNKVCVWFRCDPNAKLKARRIVLIPTGGEAPTDGKYLGTAHLQGGVFVLHVFEQPL